MNFRELKISVTPSYVKGYIQIIFKIKVDGEEYTVAKELRQNDFISMFELVWGEVFREFTNLMRSKPSTKVP
jgi:hypothetical protein